MASMSLKIWNCMPFSIIALIQYLYRLVSRLGFRSRRVSASYSTVSHVNGHPSPLALPWVARWLSGRASDLRSSSRGFEPRPRRCCVTTLGKLSHPTASVTKQYNLVPAKAGK